MLIHDGACSKNPIVVVWAASPGAPPTLLEGPIAPLREAQPTGDWAFETLGKAVNMCFAVLC